LITHPPPSPTYKKAGLKIEEEKFKDFEETSQIAKALNVRIIVFQCPASFKPSEENTENLRIFFQG